MYLKVTWADKVKKVTFKEEMKEIRPFRDYLAQITGIPEPLLRASFTDNDNETCVVTDQEDLTYFLKDSKDRQFVNIRVDQAAAPEKRDTSVEEPSQPYSSEVAFNNVTTDISVTFPQEPFHVDQSEIRGLPGDKSDNRATDLGNILKNKLSDDKILVENPPAPKAPELKYSRIDSDKNQQIQPPAPAELAKPKPEKLISDKIQLLANPKEELPPKPEPEPELMEKSAFGLSVLDRICALEKKIDYMSMSQAHLLVPPKAQEAESPKPFLKPQSGNTVIKTRHTGILCDVCKSNPIVGKRFHCLVCPEYDACEECELNYPHQHPMVRLIVQQDDEILKKLNKKYLKLAGAPSKGPIGTFIDAFKANVIKGAPEPVEPRNAFRPETAQEDLRQLLDFIDARRRLNPDLMLKKYGQLPLERFCEEINKELNAL